MSRAPASGPRRSGPLGGAALLELLEPGWRRELSAGARAAAIEVEADLLTAAARAVGDQARHGSAEQTARDWPACVVVALARFADGSDRNGSFWPGWHRAAGLRMTRRSAGEWGQAFLTALSLLGIAAPDTAQPDPGPTAADPGTGGRPEPRLDPFGQGVLAGGRPALPEEVADPADPLLVFDENGERAGPELPAERVWVLHPAGACLRSDAPPRVVVTSQLPLTWRGWLLTQLDLRGLSWLELAGQDDQDDRDDRDGTRRRHLVRGRSKPGLVTGPPVPGVTTRTGEPVFPEPPAVLLPPGAGRWRAEVRRAGTNAVLSSLVAAGDGWQPELLWRALARPLLGELTVTVIAADGEARPGMRRTLTVAEGLTASYFPAPRLTGERWLEPAEVVFATSAGMTVSPQAAPVPAEALGIDVTCIAGQARQALRVTPPHLSIRIEPEPGSEDAPTRWHDTGPLLLDTGRLWHGGALSVDLPGVSRDPPIEVVGQDGRVVQVLEPTRQGRYPLRRMADTVTAHGGASLRITVGGRTATIARIAAPHGAVDPWVNVTG